MATPVRKSILPTDELSFDNLDSKDTLRITDKLKAMPRKRAPRMLTSADETPTVTPLFLTKGFRSLLSEELPGDEEEWISIPAYEYGKPDVTDENEEAEVANRDRIELLARRYESKKISTEEEARLAIVTERVRRLMPRVTETDFMILEKFATDLNAIKKETEELYRRIGIKQIE